MCTIHQSTGSKGLKWRKVINAVDDFFLMSCDEASFEYKPRKVDLLDNGIKNEINDRLMQ